MPKNSNPLERERHVLTQTPYALWCSVCVKGRGRDDPHRAGRPHAEPELVQFDYTFANSSEETDQLAPILVGIMCSTGYAYAAVAKAKGVFSWPFSPMTVKQAGR